MTTFYFKFGKEYELDNEASKIAPKILHSTTDGSGPEEISLGVFKSIKEGIIAEYLLEQILSESALFEYYYAEENEEKGNHFHFSINCGTLPAEMLMASIIRDYAVFFWIFREFFASLLTGNFRNTFFGWNRKLYHTVRTNEVQDYSSRAYAFVTLNRNRKSALTLEVRASETSIVYDFVAFALATAFAFKSYQTRKNNIEFKQKFIDALDVLNRYYNDLYENNDTESLIYFNIIFSCVSDYFSNTDVQKLADYFNALDFSVDADTNTVTKIETDKYIDIAIEIYKNDSIRIAEKQKEELIWFLETVKKCDFDREKIVKECLKNITEEEFSRALDSLRKILKNPDTILL